MHDLNLNSIPKYLIALHHPIWLLCNSRHRLQLDSLLPTNPANDLVTLKTISKRHATSKHTFSNFCEPRRDVDNKIISVGKATGKAIVYVTTSP